MTSEEIKYISEQIKRSIHSIEHEHFQWMMNSMHNQHEDHPGWTEDWIKSRIQDVYHLILAYLEAKEMPHFLETFKATFHAVIIDEKKIMETSFYDPEGEPELDILKQFKQYLDAFVVFDYQQTREDEIAKLMSILKNTDYILKNCNTTIENEADIYKQVKWVLRLYYPLSRELNKAAFIQEFKSYHPDILVPELKTAIEYKYIKNKTDNFDEFIDQIRIDATNYTGDYRYENFVAVIYVENTSIATPENIEAAWKAKKFPNNWQLAVVNGSPTVNTVKKRVVKKKK